VEGGSGQLPASRIVFARPTQAPETPYAQKVRAALESSNDAELLSRVAEQLQVSLPNQQLAVALSDRVLRLNSSVPSYHRQNVVLKEQQRLMEIRREPGVRTDSERLALLLADSRWFGPRAREADAWMLLKLAAANRKDPNYGTGVYGEYGAWICGRREGQSVGSRAAAAGGGGSSGYRQASVQPAGYVAPVAAGGCWRAGCGG
jgi:hypothetical protein